MLLSPLDWALIESWQEREIPLRIILRGIENVFDAIDKNPNRTRTVKSLTYCKEEVEAQYAEWVETQIGKSKSSAQQVESENDLAENEAETRTNSNDNTSSSTLFPKEVIDEHLSNLEISLTKISENAEGKFWTVLQKTIKEIVQQKTSYKSAESLEEKLNELESFIDITLEENKDEKSLAELNKEVEAELAKHKQTMNREVYERTFKLMLHKHLREELRIPRFSLFYL